MSKKGRVKYSGAFSRFRDRLDSEEDEVEFDESKPVNEQLRECLKEVTTKTGKTLKRRTLSVLSALIKMWEKKEELDQSDPSSLRLREIMLCLRIPLCQDSVEVRAATLRTLRYLISSESEVHDFITINGHFLLTRCLDIELDNKVERIQALRLVRKMIFVGARFFPLTLLRSLVAIAEDGKKECDRLYRICLACLCELSVLNSQAFVEANGVNALIYCLLDSSQPRISEAIIACLLRLYNNPKTRKLANVELGVVVAPFTEFRYVHSGHLPAPAGLGAAESAVDDEKVRRFQIAENAILSLMRSWTGILQLAQPRRYGGSHLQALVDILYLQNNEVRKRLVLLFFELLNLKPPKETSHFDLALQVTNPSTFKESWKLADGFVAQEGLDILPHLAKSRPNLLENHKCFTLGCLLKTGLPEALIEVVISTEADLSILATVLLGELLYSASVILPRELNATSHCLPALLAEISGTDPNRSNRASEAVVALQKIHTIKKRGPVACSLFLDQILSSSGRFYGECFVGDRLLSPNWNSFIKRSSDDQIRLNVKQSKVNESIDAKSWDWDLISAVFKWPSENFHLLDVSDHRQFVKRVADFFKPSYHLFSKIELVSSKAKFLAKIGCFLLDFLVAGKSVESQIILDDFLLDIKSCLESLVSAKAIHDCLLSPTRVATTASQYYFAFVGRMSYTPTGRKALDKHKFLPCLVELLSLRSDLYLKLVISCLDYTSPDWGSRNLLSKALKEGSELCKLYATRFLGVLIRSRTPNIAQWGIELLVGQLFDASGNVPWAALDLLDEACDDKMNLEAVVCALGTNISLEHLGIRGAFLRNRFYTSSNSFKLLSKRDKDGKSVLENELKKWGTEWNLSYVIILEDLLNDGLTRHQRNDDRCYGRRSHEAHSLRDIYVPAHLYGQLALTKFGLENLVKDEELCKLLKYLREVSDSPPNHEWLKVKSAIWAAANIALCHEGVLVIEREGSINAIINIAEKSQVYSLRGTAFYALGLVATTRHGSTLLAKYSWCSLRYSRDEKWPVLEDWFNKFHLMTRQFESELADFEDELQDLGFDDGRTLKRAEDITISPETPPEYYLHVSSTDSSPKGASISGRKRLSDLFRSFTLGSGGSLLRQPRRNSETAKTLSDKIKKNLFPRSRTSSRGSTGERDDPTTTSAPTVSPHKAVSAAPSLKTVQESDKQAPISTPETKSHKHETGQAEEREQDVPKDDQETERVAPIAMPESYADSNHGEMDVTLKPSPENQTSVQQENQEVVITTSEVKRNKIEKATIIPTPSALKPDAQSSVEPSKGSKIAAKPKRKEDQTFTEIIQVELDVPAICKPPPAVIHLPSSDERTQQHHHDRNTPDRESDSASTSPRKFQVKAIIEPEPKYRPAEEHDDRRPFEKVSAQSVGTDRDVVSNLEEQKEIISSCGLKDNAKSSDNKLTKSFGVTNLPSMAVKELQNVPAEKASSKNDKNISLSVQTTSDTKPLGRVEKLNGDKENNNEEDEKTTPKILTLDFSKIDVSSSASSTFNKLSPIASSPTDPNTAKSTAPTFESTPMTKEQILQHSRSRSHVRSGQRALSESEAQNISGLSGTSNRRIYGNISSATAVSRNTWSITSISSVGSWTDNPGYLTFRNIHNRHRPPLSESESDATGTGALAGIRDGQPDVIASVNVHRSDSWSRKSRSLDYRLTKLRRRQMPPPSYLSEMGAIPQNRSFSAPPVRPPHLIFAVREESTGSQGPEPQYWGITLPSRIECLFPECADLPEVVEEELSVHEPISEPDLLSVSHLKVKERPTMSQGLELHTPFTCLSCYRLFAPTTTGTLIELEAEVKSSSKSAKSSPASLRKQVTVAEGEKASAAAIGAAVSSLSGGHGGEDKTGQNRFVQRKEVIRLISSMNATVGAKTAEQGLLKYKQLHPEAFNDLCLYSEVCLILTKYSFRISSRRFIQELFMDLQYEALYIEPYHLLGMDLADSIGVEAPESSSLISNRSLTQVAEAITEDTFSSAASSPFS